MIADLHCHYPMHLLQQDHHPHGVAAGWLERLKDEIDARAVAIAGHLLNNPEPWRGWRVNLDGLIKGDARLVCSVLFWPPSEFRLGTVPAPGSFEYLQSLLRFVEQELKRLDPDCTRHVIARQASDLRDPNRVVFVHCVEGGFHLGPDKHAIDANVRWLAEHGVLYITVAHLFFKGVATNAPAIPMLTDAEYGALFHEPDIGLTELGATLVEAMYKHKVLVDISHMSERAIAHTFDLIKQLEDKYETDPRDYPVLATHVGMRSVKGDQAYNLTDATAKRISDRGGLIGVIMAQHQLGDTANAEDSERLVKKHIDAIGKACSGPGSCAIGTDIDGFIKPTLAGFDYAADYGKLAAWITKASGTDASAILHDNALSLIERVFTSRDQARHSAKAAASAAPAPAVVPAADGYHHPASEAELVELVKLAADEKRKLRVRGSAHSVSHAIYADPLDPLDGIPNTVSWQTPPASDAIHVMLDRYRGWRVLDHDKMLVEADAGIHLGADPSDPTGTATLRASLLYQLWQQQAWMLSNVGGITHQTVSGFTATGSSGGSIKFSANDDLYGFQIIDGQGNVERILKGQANFGAMSPNLGLLGVVSKVILKCIPAYNISGRSAISTVDECAVDLFGAGTPERPKLEDFLRNTEYARLEWWPQRGAERVEVWQAERITAAPGFRPVPYEQFTAHPQVAEPVISILLTVFGNLENLSGALPQLHVAFARVDDLLDAVPLIKQLGPLGHVLAKFLSRGAEHGADAAVELLRPFAPLIRRERRAIFAWLLGMFVPLDSAKSGADKGQPQRFQDYAWHGLPMDNEADDVLLRTAFTEIWVPVTKTQDAMVLLRDYFGELDDEHAPERTGFNAWELYAAKPTDLWMSPSHTGMAEGAEDVGDEWKEGAFRIDPFWFGGNPGDPIDFYKPLWELFESSDIPFRLHWGKYQPASDAWVAYFRRQYPHWGAFLKLRDARDPGGTFRTDYWDKRVK